MRSTKALFATILFMLMIWPGASVIARADTDDDADEYDVTARVIRTSLLRGEVSLRRAGNKGWESATLNLPLVEGDTLATGADARLEIQIDARNFVRVGADSVLRIVTLRDDGIALSLVAGTATLRLARFDRDKEYFEIDAPKTTLAAEKPGLYRLDVGRDAQVRLTVRDGGRARIYSETSGFILRDGRSAELVDSGADEGDWQLTAASSPDSWDEWVNERERYLASRLRYEQQERYYDTDIWGAEELDAYGDWVYVGDYGGWVWRPHTTVINNYYNWTPYRYGHWRWCPPYGWTWVGDEPWGWAPYHYGRWVYYNNNWCWSPRSSGLRNRRNWWRPALVAFVYVPTSYGEHIAWYPLGYGQHDPSGRNWRRNPDRLTPLRAGERDNLRRVNPAYVRAVTTVPAREFGSQRARLQPATTDIAQRAVTGEPVRARLPIAPTDQENNVGDRDRETRGRARPARPAPTVPAQALPERPTGASLRQPGVPLDEELRRTRLFNGRNPRTPSPPAAEAGADPADRSTGAVARPARPSIRPSLERDADEDRNFRNNAPSRARPARPERPERPNSIEVRPPVSTDENVAPREREPRPTRAPRHEAPPPPPEAPRVEPSRPEPRHEAPAPRHEAPPPPREEPVRREETPAPPPPSPPPPREEPPPRAEPPREREAPAHSERQPEHDRARPPRD